LSAELTPLRIIRGHRDLWACASSLPKKTRSLEEETWLAKTDRDGYERWKAIFARSILAWRLYVGVHRTKTAWHEPVETAKADDKLQMMMMMMIDDEKHPKIQQDVAYWIDMTIVLSPSE